MLGSGVKNVPMSREQLPLELNSAKETAAAANARNVNAKTGKKKRQ